MIKNKLIVLIFILFEFITSLAHAQTKQIVVIIDPGHGGKDPGNLKRNEKCSDEKVLNLIIAKKFGGYIDSLLQNVKIIYTRTTDTFVSPQERAEFANANKADYYISIHCNSHENSEINGVEIHIHNYSCKEAYSFAKKLDDQLRDRAARNSRGIKTYDDRRNTHILVVKDTEMPAVLVECGFMTNPDEELFLNTDYGQSLIASAIYRAFRDYSKAELKKVAKPLDKKLAEKKLAEKKLAEKKLAEKKLAEKKQKVKAEPVYRVQIKASTASIPLPAKEFSKIKEKVEEMVVNDSTPFKYKYYVGKFDNMKEANKLKNKLRKDGFPDAFVVAVK